MHITLPHEYPYPHLSKLLSVVRIGYYDAPPTMLGNRSTLGAPMSILSSLKDNAKILTRVDN